jgi:hypothetical protein
MSDIIPYDPANPKGHLKALQGRMAENDRLIDKVEINVFYSEAAGSDPKIMALIAYALQNNLPFGLRCQRSNVIFIPHKFKAYWRWSDGEHGPTFTYTCKDDLIKGVKMQYLTHKEFITTAELTALAKVIYYERALNVLGHFQRKAMSQSGLPTGQMEAGGTGILPGGDEWSEEVSEHPGAASESKLLPEPIRNAEELSGDGQAGSAGNGG